MKDKNPPENLGQVVFGERLRASPYQIHYKENKTFEPLCTRSYDLTKARHRHKLEFLISRIKEGYMHAWVIDNMPVTWCYKVLNTDKQFCSPRFPVGCYVSKDGTRQEACYISVSMAGFYWHYSFFLFFFYFYCWFLCFIFSNIFPLLGKSCYPWYNLYLQPHSVSHLVPQRIKQWWSYCQGLCGVGLL